MAAMFLECMGNISSYLPKYSGLTLVSAAHFLHISSMKIFPYLMPYQLTKFQYQTFYTTQDIKQYVFLNCM